MAYFKIETDRRGKLKARIQVSGKDYATGKAKLFTKKVYNDDNLTEAKFRKQVDKIAIAFEDEVARAYAEQESVMRDRVLTFSELAEEWVKTVKNHLSYNYYLHARDVTKRFNDYLITKRLDKKPLSEITVRDVQLYLNTFSDGYAKQVSVVKLKQDLPNTVNFRQLARDGIINRCSSYGMRRKGNNVTEETAKRICEICELPFDEYFEIATANHPYSPETIKGHRRVLRTLFNEAVRYDWITKNPVCATKIGAGNSNSCLREVPEKEVYSFAEAKEFLKALDKITDEYIFKRIPLEIMLLTGLRLAEVCGLRWADVDFDRGVLHVRRNRLPAKGIVYEKAPKTKTSIRDVPMPENLIADLRKYYDWFAEADSQFRSKLDEYYLAVNMYRLPLYPHTVGHWLKTFEEEHHFRYVSCHGLRHTYCSLLLSQNVPIQTVSKYMGHSDSTVTLKVYSHFIPDTQDRVLNALAKLAS